MDLEQVQRDPLLKWMIEHLRTYGMGLQDIDHVMSSSGSHIRGDQESDDDFRTRIMKYFEDHPTEPVHVLTKVTIIYTPPMATKPAAPEGTFARLLEDILVNFKEALSPFVSKSNLKGSPPDEPREVKTPDHWLLIQEVILNRKAGELPKFTVLFGTRPREPAPPCERNPKWV